MQNTILANLLMADYLRQAPAWFYNRVLVGAGAMLTPTFVRKYGITHVINCAGPEDSPPWFRGSFPSNYVCLDAQDSLTTNILGWYPRFEACLHTFLRHGTGTVFVHCQAGINRSAFLTLTYVCKNLGIPFEQAYENAKKQRPIMFQNPVFRKQVEGFIRNGRVSSS